MNRSLSRRSFLKLAALGAGSLALRPLTASGRGWHAPLFQTEFPDAERLGRVCQGMSVVYARPDLDSKQVDQLYEDSVTPWVREVIADKPSFVFNNQRWVETPYGYVQGYNFQPVSNRPNQPIKELPRTSLGPGMWAEVTIPYVDAILETDPSPNSWVAAKREQNLPVRLYYSQVFWIDRIKTSEQGKTLYHINPNYYGGLDQFWADAAAFRPITAEDLAPINPDAANKEIIVDVTHQTLSCLEGKTEVYFCRVSTGAKFNMYGEVVDKWATPVGWHRVSRKFVSLQMSGGTTGAGYDLPGIGWTSIFFTGGVAIHSTFWHNNYGDPMSHGCVNARPEDAQWIFRWTSPTVTADPGMMDVTLTGQDSTKVTVIEA